jgi:ribosome-binding factor A
MSRRKRKADDLKPFAAELSGEDGSNAKEFHTRPWNKPRQASRKGQQFCSQVKDVLRSVFAGCADPVLQQLTVVLVQPAPHTGRLLVLVSSSTDASEIVKASLMRAAGFLRTELATAVSRRSVPELVFEVL